MLIFSRLSRHARQQLTTMRPSSTAVALPRLPVPNLRDTLDRYLKSIQPFLLEDEARGGAGYDSSYATRVRWADEFDKGIGQVCQQRLLDLDKSSPNNWLNDNFWMNKAYLEWRAPLIVNSNWWLTFKNDDSVPEDVINRKWARDAFGITNWQIRRAAWLTYRILDFKERLDRQELYPETTRTGIWLRESTSKMFNASRIPQPKCDIITYTPAHNTPHSKKIVIVLHDWFYVIDVYDESHQRLSVTEIEARMRAVVEDASKRLARMDKAVPVGILTSDDRDRWAQNQEHLLSLSADNHRIIKTINQSLFCVSLDNYTNSPSANLPQKNSQTELDAHLHNARAGRGARNRWFDKTFTLIVESNTRAGAMGEHAPCDALVPSIVADYAVVQSIDANEFTLPSPPELRASYPAQSGWERLDWVVDEALEVECMQVGKRAQAILDDSDNSVMWFAEYGGDWIKSVAKFSPDAYLQMVLQLAWYKTRGSFCATYETALTRMFRQGRTETIRTYTTDSRAFVLGMQDPSLFATDRYRLLKRAIQTHTSLSRLAATGRGIDRHLFGLRLMLQREVGERHELLDDELFERSQQWKLSTSALSEGHQFRGTGFGAAYHDGYGINYLGGPEVIKFGIESKFSSPHTSTEAFKIAIKEALHDIQLICSAGPEDNIITSHL